MGMLLCFRRWQNTPIWQVVMIMMVLIKREALSRLLTK
jgi:hypothetical protein